MRDVIVVGAGGGGAVIAKELASRGLDVLLLEPGARFANLEKDWTHFESDANNPYRGYSASVRPTAPSPNGCVNLPAACSSFNSLAWAGQQITTSGILRARCQEHSWVRGIDKQAYDMEHLFPFSYCELIPYYEWVEATLPVQTAPMGLKEEVFFRGAELLGLPFQSGKDITRAAFRPQENAILQPHGTAGRTADPHKLNFPHAKGCTFCGHCSQGCFEPKGAPTNLKAKQINVSQLRADGADRR